MRPLVFELCVMKKEEEERKTKKKKEEERRITKSKISTLFSQLLCGVAELLGHFYNSIGKAFCL